MASVRAAHGRDIITSVQPFASTGQRAVSSGLDGLLRIWDCASAEEETQIVTSHARGINNFAINADCHAISCGDDGITFMYDLGAGMRADRNPLRRFQGHSASAYCVAWTSPSTFATGGFDRRTLMWDCRSPAQHIACLPARHHVYALAPLVGSAGNVAVDGSRVLAVGLADGAIAQWDLRSGSTKEPLREMRGHFAAVESLAVLPGDVLASASADGTMRLWDRNGDAAWLWTGRGPLTGVASVMEDSLLVSGLGFQPTVLALDYVDAAHCVPDVLERLHLPTLQAWKRGLGDVTTVPPEGIGRHSDLLSQRRMQRGSVRRAKSGDNTASFTSTSRGPFDRAPAAAKPIKLGATGAAHRAFLCGVRR